MDSTFPYFTTEIAAVVFTVGGIALGIQKLVKHWTMVSAENSVVKLMHTELERVGQQNRLLAEELNKLQLEIISLNKELRNLSIENSKLHEQIYNFSSEVCRLQSLLNRHVDFKDNSNDNTD